MLRSVLCALLVFVAALPARATDKLNFDSVVRLIAQAEPEARSARTLGAVREGNGIVIDSRGLILTIGYLIVEARAVAVVDSAGRTIPAELVAYDYDTGFGLVRALGPLAARPLPLGDSAAAQVNRPMVAMGHGGVANAVPTVVVSRRPFAGYWEYLLEDAIYTSPPHSNWGGAALVGEDGRLYGVGSLFVGNARTDESQLPGNMFVPIDLLKPILADMLADGRPATTARPWLGVTTRTMLGHVVIAAVTEGGPAAGAGVRPGDVVIGVGRDRIDTVADFYRALWKGREAGAVVPLRVVRGGATMELQVRSVDRYSFLSRPSTF